MTWRNVSVAGISAQGIVLFEVDATMPLVSLRQIDISWRSILGSSVFPVVIYFLLIDTLYPQSLIERFGSSTNFSMLVGLK